MASDHRIEFDGETAVKVLACIKKTFQKARIREVGADAYHVEVSQGRFLIVENDDIHSDRSQIIRAVIEKAKKGDLDAVKFLLDHSNFEFPDFQVNGEE